MKHKLLLKKQKIRRTIIEEWYRKSAWDKSGIAAIKN